MVITTLAAWVGVSAAPLTAYVHNDYAALSGPAAVLDLGALGEGGWSDLTDRKR